jgi:tetratricopeptide (TPR) repeat protein
MLQQAIQAFQAGNYDSADLMLTRVLQVDSKNLLALQVIALLKASQTNYGEAANFLGRAARISPNDATVRFNLAKALTDSGNDKDAIAHHKKAIALAPNNPEIWLSYGNTTSNLGRYNDALLWFGNALSLNSDYVEAELSIAITLYKLKRYDEAIYHYDKALSLKPDYREAWSNKGVTLNELKRFEEAIAHYDKALSLKPDYHEAWSNKGVTLNELKRFDEAIAHYDKALSLKPDYHEASFNKSLSLLLQGDFENGLPLYESRWYSEKITAIADKRIFENPTWLGVDSLADKTILIYGEQGLGDFIQFCRYVKLVSDLGAKVILETPQSLASLMGNLEGVTELVIKGEELPFFDYQCPILSLPLAFKTKLNTIPNLSRYINLDSHPSKIMEWKARLGYKLKPRIGLAWSGNANHKNDHNRSILLGDILQFLPNQFEYVSLQKEVREVDKLTLESNPHILNFANHLNDFLDTAALIDNLDLVISVDTSVAHLSGALGKKTLVLLPSVLDWRWLLDREDSPWYPSMKLYRQPVSAVGDWNGVLDRVRINSNGGYVFQCGNQMLPSLTWLFTLQCFKYCNSELLFIIKV